MGEEIRINWVSRVGTIHMGKSMLSVFMVVCLLFCGVLAVPVNLYRTVYLSLDYDYLPGEHYWSKFGSIDSRKFELWIDKNRDVNLGRIITDEGYEYILQSPKNFNDYFTDAAATILTRYGITLLSPSAFRLEIYPLKVLFYSADPDDDGDKFCTVKLKVKLIKDKSTLLFEAIVENQGVDDFDVDDAEDYADLLDQTIHGAMVKIWASQVLFTENPLGRGRIIKKDKGVYGFMPGVIHLKGGDTPDSSGMEQISPHAPETAGTPFLQRHPAITGDPEQGDIITGAYTGSDSVVVVEGKKITIGILPFENATGYEKQNAAANEVRDQLQVELSRSQTVKVMDREKLSEVLREQALGLTGIMNDSTVVSVGNISGVRAMVAGKLTRSGSYYRLNARIINVETSAIVTAVSVKIPDANAITSAIPDLAARLLYAFTEEKLKINRNTMSYPSISPVAISAVTAAVEDAWAVEINPACLMKVKSRDANYFVSFGKKLSGKLGSQSGKTVETRQPPFEKMGVNVALPIGSRFASGFGVQHQYTFPKLETSVGTEKYDIKEEETIFTLPVAFGVNPKLSFGGNLRMHITEYQITNPGVSYVSGNVVSMEGKVATLFKVSERFRAGLTFQPESFYVDAKEKRGTSEENKKVSRKTSSEFRFGIAMYPLKWCFFFSDLEYEKQPGNPKIQPGFHLGLQFTYTGRPLNIKFMSEYGMMPFFVGYSHEPYNKMTATQNKYISFGTGYFLNNIYVRLSMRFNVEKEEERKIVVGLPDNSSVTLFDYRLSTPVFLCVGYRF